MTQDHIVNKHSTDSHLQYIAPPGIQTYFSMAHARTP